MIIIGFVAALLFTALLWRSRGSLLTAACYAVVVGFFAVGTLAVVTDPTFVAWLETVVKLQDDMGRVNPEMVIWGVVLFGLFGVVIWAPHDTP